MGAWVARIIVVLTIREALPFASVCTPSQPLLFPLLQILTTPGWSSLNQAFPRVGTAFVQAVTQLLMVK